MIYEIKLDEVKNSDVSAMSAYTLGGADGVPDYIKYDFNTLGGGIENGMQYKFLNYIGSKVFKDQILLDIGSRGGFSALALGLSKLNTVMSYDIADYRQYWDHIVHSLGYHNITFNIQDANKLHPSLLNSSPFINLDIDPHDGLQEERFFETLRSINYNGLVMLDDTLWEDMKPFIKSIKEPIVDITKYAHSSGTLLVDFSYGKRFKIV